jgi:hypothetical protein
MPKSKGGSPRSGRAKVGPKGGKGKVTARQADINRRAQANASRIARGSTSPATTTTSTPRYNVSTAPRPGMITQAIADAARGKRKKGR